MWITVYDHVMFGEFYTCLKLRERYGILLWNHRVVASTLNATSFKHTSLAWPGPISAQGRYRFQYKPPARKRGAYTESDNAPARK